MLYKDVKLEERAENEPKFNGKNKTDRKILFFVILSMSILLVILGGLIALYYIFFYQKPNPNQVNEVTETAIRLITKISSHR